MEALSPHVSPHVGEITPPLSAPLSYPFPPLPESELPDAIRHLTPLQQALISALSAHPTWDRGLLSKAAGCSHSVVNSWYSNTTTHGPQFRRCYDAIKSLAINALPAIAISTAREHSLLAMKTTIDYGLTLSKTDPAAVAQAKLRANETTLKVAGVLPPEQPQGIVSIQQALVQINESRDRPLGGIPAPKLSVSVAEVVPPTPTRETSPNTDVRT